MNEIPNQNIEGILLIAKKYELTCIVCDSLIRSLNEQNVIWCLEFSRKELLTLLEFSCVDFMKENGEQIIRSEAFMECSQKQLKIILELNIFWDNKAKPLIDACMKWAKKYCEKNQLDPENEENLRMALDDYFTLIPFSEMNYKDFKKFQSQYGGFFTANDIDRVLKGRYHSRPRPKVGSSSMRQIIYTDILLK